MDSEKNAYDELFSHIFKNQNIIQNDDELKVYLREPVADTKTDVLAWWKLHQSQYPNLSKMAQDYLAIPGVDAGSHFQFLLYLLMTKKKKDGKPCGMKFLFEHTKGSTSNTLHHLQNDHNLLRPELSRKKTSKSIHKEGWLNSVVTDFWASIDNKGYVGITCSWLEDFEPVEVLLNLLYVPHPHTSEIIKELLLVHEIERWGLNEKIIAIATDNGSNMTRSIRLLGEVMEVERIPCAAHMLQLSVKKGLKINDNIEILILRARRLILFFKSQWERLGEVQRQLNYQWNSTYKAWVHLLDLKDAIKELINRMQFEKWTLIKELVFISKDFNDITTTLSGNSFVTLSLVYPTISHLIKKLQSQISDNNDDFESFDEFI
nr:6388_t:CDS:2 [Entrophospora candida]